ncbi:hypothetical protein L345_07357, partial [Ophiophagus hannah]
MKYGKKILSFRLLFNGEASILSRNHHPVSDRKMFHRATKYIGKQRFQDADYFHMAEVVKNYRPLNTLMQKIFMFKGLLMLMASQQYTLPRLLQTYIKSVHETETAFWFTKQGSQSLDDLSRHILAEIQAISKQAIASKVYINKQNRRNVFRCPSKKKKKLDAQMS